MLSRVETPTAQAPSKGGYILPLIGLAVAGVAIWKGLDWLKEIRSGKETEKAQKETLKHEISLQKTKQRIAEIERTKGIVKGLNAYNKQVSVNVINQAKDLIYNFYTQVNLSTGYTKFWPRPKKDINQEKIILIIRSTPINGYNLLQKIYTIYTGKNLLDDIRNFAPDKYELSKALFNLGLKYGR